MGSSFVSSSARPNAAGTRLSTNSRSTSSLKDLRTTESGTLPFRNPGRRTLVAILRATRSYSCAASSAGTSMARIRCHEFWDRISTLTFTMPPKGVRERGLEPLRVSSLDPKSSASANFATLASSDRLHDHCDSLAAANAGAGCALSASPALQLVHEREQESS